MKIIKNNIIPFPGYKVINLFGILFTRKTTNLDEIDINHEAIHTALMKELLYLPFYILYGIEYIIKLFKYKNPYKNLSFEREAYANQDNLLYLLNRKHYAEWR